VSSNKSMYGLRSMSSLQICVFQQIQGSKLVVAHGNQNVTWTT
jgi:hypothetical protein